MTPSEIRALNPDDISGWPEWLRVADLSQRANWAAPFTPVTQLGKYHALMLAGALTYAEYMQSEWQRIATEADSIAGYAGAIVAEARGIERRARWFGEKGRGDGQ